MASFCFPLCLACARHRPADDTCSAFPFGIPADILVRSADHRVPIAGDDGVTFKARTDPEGRDILDVWLHAHGEGE